MGLAVSFFYAVSLGVDVVTTTHLVAAGGRPDRIPLEHRTRHVPAHLCSEHLYLGAGLVVEHPEVRAAALRVARRADSELGVSEGPPPASGGTCVSTLRDVVAWASAARKVRRELVPKAVSEHHGIPLRRA